MSVDTTGVFIDALMPGGAYRARTTEVVHDVAGRPVAQLSLAPAMLVGRTVARMRRAALPDLESRRSALARAATIFREGTIGGLGPETYSRIVARTSGLNIDVIERSISRVAEVCESAYERAQYARPRGAVDSVDDPAALVGTALWTRRGDVFGVHAAGNHPSVHANWIEAVALGYRVVVRPSRREPFTGFRLISAMHEAGLADQVAYLPTDHATADDIIRLSDMAMVFGGDDVIEKYADNPTVIAQGPGRAKILITSDVDANDFVELVAQSVSVGGGTSCTSTTAVFVEKDADGFASALSRRLAEIQSQPPELPGGLLPVRPIDEAAALADYVEKVGVGTSAVGPCDEIVDDLGDGSAALRPSVRLAASPDAAQANVELPFPCVWVLPWSASTGLAPLRSSLAVTLITRDESIVDAAIADPTIRNVYVGAVPTGWNAAHAPHDGYLADHLMEVRSFVRDPAFARDLHPVG